MIKPAGDIPYFEIEEFQTVSEVCLIDPGLGDGSGYQVMRAGPDLTDPSTPAEHEDFQRGLIVDTDASTPRKIRFELKTELAEEYYFYIRVIARGGETQDTSDETSHFASYCSDDSAGISINEAI